MNTNAPTPEAGEPPAPPPGRDPANEIADLFFGALTVLPLAAAVVGFPFWERPVLTSLVMLALAAAGFAARLATRRGHHVRAMHAFGAFILLVSVLLTALSVHLVGPIVIMITVLPAYAAVCGRAPAFAVGALYLLAAVGIEALGQAGYPFPRVFPVPPAAQIMAGALAIAGILWPLAKVFDRLREAVQTAHDEIGRRRLAEAGMVHAKEFSERLIETANVMVLGLDRNGRVIIFNGKAEQVTGYARAQLIGSDWFSTVMPPEQAAAGLASFQRAMAAGAALPEGELTLRTRTGETRRILWCNNLLPDPQGEQISVSLGIDVTERRAEEIELAQYRESLERRVAERSAEVVAATEALAASDQEKQAILDAAPVGILVTREQQILRCNRTLEQVLGYRIGEVTRLALKDLYADPADHARAQERVDREVADGRIYREDVQLRRRDGSVFWGRLSLRMIDVADRSRGLAGTVEDIAGERQAIGEMNLARSQAEGAVRAKSDFLVNMSHDIRTPLNAVIGIAHLIRRGGLTEEQAEQMHKLESSAEHLLEILNTILDLSKIEAGRFVLEEQPMRVEATVANVMSLIDERARDKDLRLLSEVEHMPHDLVGDTTRLQQALLNYALNAVKFTDEGEVTLRARLIEEDDATALVRFEVQDTGVGIDPAVIPRLFTAFEHADTSTTRKLGGTGLGLAITRRLAELMGGSAGVQSVPGVGSTFWFTVRLRKSPPVVQAQALDGPEDALSVLRRDWAGTPVLVAEDNDINREVAGAILEDAGFAVDFAVDGVEAVGRAVAHDYGFVLMDIQMPRMDGLDATREIRRSHPKGTLPIIAMTANVSTEDRARCFESGMDDFIGKPVSPESLYAVLLNWLERSGRPPAA